VFRGTDRVLLWDANTRQSSLLDTDERSSLTFVRWSTVGSILIIGTMPTP
jgi:hypothetical protein